MTKIKSGGRPAPGDPPAIRAEQEACQNTDRELWRERPDDYYADSIHVTEYGSIGINAGGMVYVLPLREWHRLAASVQVKTDAYQTGFADGQAHGRAEREPESELLKRAKTFIEYARYELQPGLAQIGDQFPRQEDADKVINELAAAIRDRETPPQPSE